MSEKTSFLTHIHTIPKAALVAILW